MQFLYKLKLSFEFLHSVIPKVSIEISLLLDKFLFNMSDVAILKEYYSRLLTYYEKKV